MCCCANEQFAGFNLLRLLDALSPSRIQSVVGFGLVYEATTRAMKDIKTHGWSGWRMSVQNFSNFLLSHVCVLLIFNCEKVIWYMRDCSYQIRLDCSISLPSRVRTFWAWRKAIFHFSSFFLTLNLISLFSLFSFESSLGGLVGMKQRQTGNSTFCRGAEGWKL